MYFDRVNQFLITGLFGLYQLSYCIIQPAIPCISTDGNANTNIYKDRIYTIDVSALVKQVRDFVQTLVKKMLLFILLLPLLNDSAN